MKIIHKAEVRLVNDADTSKSTYLTSRTFSVDLTDEDPTAADLSAASYARLVEDKDFDVEKFEKFKEEVTKPSKHEALAVGDKLFGTDFFDRGKVVAYTVYVKNKVVPPLEGNDAYKAAKKAAMAATP